VRCGGIQSVEVGNMVRGVVGVYVGMAVCVGEYVGTKLTDGKLVGG
jgi:hypothetical protein